MKIRKTLASILASLALLLPNSQSNACTGARQNAMGNAGVAACENSHAIYWNQASLALQKQAEISYTKQIGKKEEARYDDIVSASFPLTKRLGAGIQLMKSQKGSLEEKGWDEKQSWIKAGLGYLLREGKEWDVSIGGALTQKTIDYEEITNGNKTQKNRTGMQYDASILAERKNIFQDKDKLRLGILARQQIGVTKDLDNLAVRPGASYSFENALGETTASFEFYELDELIREEKAAGKDIAKPRFGIEQKLGKKEKNIALRAGYDAAGDGGKGVLTAGAGLEYKNFGLDIAFTDKNVGWVGLSYKF